MQIRLNLHFQVISQVELRWPLTLICDLRPHKHEGFHIISINQVWFKSNFQLFKWGHFHIFSLSYNLTSDDLWPWYMTFAWTYEGSHIISINQVWFKSDFQLFKCDHFHIFSHHTTWPQMTFDLDTWPLISSTNEGSHVASMTQLWLKSIKACGRWSQMLTLFTTDNNYRGQSDPYVSFLLRQATQKWQDSYCTQNNLIQSKIRLYTYLTCAVNSWSTIMIYIPCTKILVLWLVESRLSFELFIASGDKTSYYTPFGSAKIIYYCTQRSLYIRVISIFNTIFGRFALRMRLIRKSMCVTLCRANAAGAVCAFSVMQASV